MAPPSKLAVATLAVRRLVKEEASYHKEQERQEESIKKLEADQSDENAEYLLKQEVEHLILSWQSIILTCD
jgi:tubulin-specific chaperone A